MKVDIPCDCVPRPRIIRGLWDVHSMEDYNAYDVQSTIELFVENGLIQDQRQPNFD